MALGVAATSSGSRPTVTVAATAAAEAGGGAGNGVGLAGGTGVSLPNAPQNTWRPATNRMMTPDRLMMPAWAVVSLVVRLKAPAEFALTFRSDSNRLAGLAQVRSKRSRCRSCRARALRGTARA